jgi:hypothetical protein
VIAIGGVLAVYLVGRGIAEFFTVNYSDPPSYRLPGRRLTALAN